MKCGESWRPVCGARWHLALVCLALALGASNASAQYVPGPWAAADVGAPAIAGRSTSTDGQTFDVSAAGYDIWGSADEFHFVYQPIAGDAEIVARVDTLAFTHRWSKAGVMIRSSLAANAAHGFALLSAGEGLAFQRRVATGGTSSHTAGPAAAAPYWVRLIRSGTTITAAFSSDGITWTTVGSDTIDLGATAYLGIAVTSHNISAAADAAISQVRVTERTSEPLLPEPFQNGDVGSPALSGSASHSAGTFTVSGAGADIWGTADQFHYVYQAVTGDVDVRARVASLEFQHRWSKAGVMVREALLPGSRHAYALMSAGSGNAFQRRIDPDGLSTHTGGWAVAPSGWVRLVRTADQFDAYQSTDGVDWTLIGSEVIPMGATVYVGLAVTSHHEGALTEAVFDNVSIGTAAPPDNDPPVVSVTAPAGGATFTAPASFTVTADASDSDGSVARVEFYRDGTLIATDTSAPYAAQVSSLAAGTYTFTAQAYDEGGAWTTSAAVTVTVETANQGPSVTISSPANGAAFVAPASFTVSATASDADGSVARVEFYLDGTLIATDATAPYAAAVSSLAAGSYVFTARAFDDDDASSTSADVTVTVSANQGPAVAITSPANGAAFTAPASFTVTADASDSDGSVARVEFYRDGTLIATDTSAPYAAQVSSVAAGTYTFAAVAFDTAGASTESAAITVTVNPAPLPPPTGVAFTASADHADLVTRYVLEIFATGADPETSTPIATSDLGKPTPDAASEISVDRSAFFQALAPGNYVATVRADGSGGASRSTAVTFTR